MRAAIALLVAASTAAACANPPRHLSAADVPCGYHVVRGDGFEVALPMYWSAVPATGGARVVLTAKGPLAFVRMERMNAAGSAADVGAKVQRAFAAVHGLVRVRERWVHVDGEADALAIEFRFTETTKNSLRAYHAWAFAPTHAGKLYLLNCVVAEEEAATLRDVCESIVGSLVLTP